MRATPSLVKLHIEQGYLATARGMLDDLARRGAVGLEPLEAMWERAARRARVEAMRAALNHALARVRRARRRGMEA